MSHNVVLLGRDEECAVLEDVLAQAREGTSGVIVVSGAPGIGKTVLLDRVVESASDFQVVRAWGVESEMEFAFAALHQVCGSLLGGLDHLPIPQRRALETAFGLSVGEPPDPFFVGLGMLSLLSAAALEKPLLCVVDDVQWLDNASAQALGVVARRLDADAVALVLATRDGPDRADLSGLRELHLDGLSASDARFLLSSALPGPVDERVTERLLRETQGNPLALIELPRGMTAGQLAGGFGLLEKLGIPGRIEVSFRRRLETLPAASRALLLVAAAEPSGDAALLWRACEFMGIGPEAAGPAEDEDLIRIDSTVRFFHPLVRSAVYQAAAMTERRQAHRALAEALDPTRDPDGHAWHRAEATSGPDEDVAVALQHCAQRAQARGGLAAAAAFLERSVALTVDVHPRSERALAAAEATHQIGSHARAIELLALADAGPLDDKQRAQAERLRGLIIYQASDGRDGWEHLLRAAEALETLDAHLSQTTLIEALHAANTSLSRDVEVEVGRALIRLPDSQPPDPTLVLLRGFGSLFVEGFPSGLDLIRQALDVFRSTPFGGDEHPYVLKLAADAALSFWDDAGSDVLTEQSVQLARTVGALAHWVWALDERAYVLTLGGQLSEATACIDEAEAIQPGYSTIFGVSLHSEVTAGLRDGDSDLCDSLRRKLRQQGDGSTASQVIASGEGSLAMLYNGLGRYRDAFEAGVRSRALHPAGGFGLGLAELVEAATRCDELDVAHEALEGLTVRTQLGGTDWALGVEACARALLSDDAVAEDLYLEAIERLGRTRMRLPFARAHLVYGEWLRRQRRRSDAREQLRVAHDLFDDMGATSFAARARTELGAHGIHRAQPAQRHARPADTARGADRHPGRRRADQRRDRRSALHQPGNRRLPPQEDLPQARRALACRTRRHHHHDPHAALTTRRRERRRGRRGPS